jgi:hypothetical protein
MSPEPRSRADDVVADHVEGMVGRTTSPATGPTKNETSFATMNANGPGPSC